MGRLISKSFPEIIDEFEDRLSKNSFEVDEIIWKYEDVCKELQKSKKQLMHMIGWKKIPFHRINSRTTIFLRSEILKWLHEENYLQNFFYEKYLNKNSNLLANLQKYFGELHHKKTS